MAQFSAPPPQLQFLRFEFKYVLDQATRLAIEERLQPFVDADPRVLSQPQHRYSVRSLYYDDAALTSFHDKADGLRSRSKFRLRTYARAAGDPAPWFLEVKGRRDQFSFKRRTPVLGSHDSSLRGEALTQMLLRDARSGDVRDEFEFAVFRRGIRPVALVDYVRRPYVSKFDPDFRLTFDSEITACATDALFPGPSAVFRQVARGHTVLEVKFAQRVPAWFVRIVEVCELRRRPFSKICESIVALGIRPRYA